MTRSTTDAPAASTLAGAPEGRDKAQALAGIGMMLIGILVFSINDVMGKWLVATYSVGQVLLLRSFGGLAMLAPLAYRAGWRTLFIAPAPRGLHLLRAVLSTLEVALFYLAVAYLPLADTMTLYLACPIFVTIAAGPLLGEKIGWRRWLAVLVGFVGVVIAVGPGGGWSVAHAIALLGSLSFAGLNIITRRLAGSDETGLAVWQTLSALAFGLVAAPFDWVMPSLRDLLLLFLLGIIATIAHMCVNRSLRLAPAAVVVPYQYTMIVHAAIFGYVFFDDVPGWNVVFGAVLIVAAGLFIFFREQMRAREKAALSD